MCFSCQCAGEGGHGRDLSERRRQAQGRQMPCYNVMVRCFTRTTKGRTAGPLIEEARR